ncbi:MAG: TrmH family RNA methyltransferase [Geminicoccaceae bacterium]
MLIEGFHALKHALRFGASIELAVADDLDAVADLAGSLAPDIAGALRSLVRPVDRNTLRGLTPEPHATGVLAIARRPTVEVSRLLEPSPEPVVLLERPTHLGNVGAVVRVAAAAGAAGVLTTGPLDPWHPAALRGSAGLHFALAVAHVDTLGETARQLVAFSPDGSPSALAGMRPGSVLAFGTERGGLGPDLLSRAERRVALPMRPGVSSLNLATSVAIALYAKPNASLAGCAAPYLSMV